MARRRWVFWELRNCLQPKGNKELLSNSRLAPGREPEIRKTAIIRIEGPPVFMGVVDQP